MSGLNGFERDDFNNERDSETQEFNESAEIEVFKRSLENLRNRIESFDEEKEELVELRQAIENVENSSETERAENIEYLFDSLDRNKEVLEQQEIIESEQIEELKTILSQTKNNLQDLKSQLSGSEKELLKKAEAGRNNASNQVARQVDEIIEWGNNRGGPFGRLMAWIGEKARG
ncbi:hypothetical protein [Candidatus Absconditicoccus praedator]|uniref:hypothetical protein n=1 Tax=Candidatus Absconditicoccus praedator TaxID=2735562 RepID=UPI001E28EE88|nr:hypothetical protein [Candidatus Absconditicoccus praedator]UFX82550.1 hypothetical protein HLG78_00150 [Candidatus Absconditicoccus praedator]